MGLPRKFKELFGARGVAVNMSPCRGEDRRFESGRARLRLAVARLRRGKARSI